VSHPCHQCGAEVDEGNPFCRQCGSPQIRVNRGGEEPPANPASTATSYPPAGTSTQPTHGGLESIGINQRVARSQALKAGILIALILVVSSRSMFSLLLIPLAGMLAVQLYIRRVPGHGISAGTGAGIGLLTGLFGFLIYIVPSLSILIWGLEFHPDWAPVQQLRGQFEAAIRNNPNPQAQQMLQHLLTPGGLLFLIIFGSAILLILCLVLSAIGGAIGARLSKRRP